MDSRAELETRVAELELRVSSLENTLRVIVSSFQPRGEPQSAPSYTSPTPAPSGPTPAPPRARPANSAPLRGVFVAQDNTPDDLYARMKRALAIPVSKMAESVEEAATVIHLAFTPSARPDEKHTNIAGQDEFWIVLFTGSMPVAIPDTRVIMSHQVSLQLDESFLALATTQHNAGAWAKLKFILRNRVELALLKEVVY